ncbi:hypothetical protein LEP1GSC021_3739 [Leptospira noguchii str. 1993005606]|nr:hypothetical protein LEP1GSC021_3739 [Leptospira noguchii str. 1993005606]
MNFTDRFLNVGTHRKHFYEQILNERTHTLKKIFLIFLLRTHSIL